jgi:hypothetical protein
MVAVKSLLATVKTYARGDPLGKSLNDCKGRVLRVTVAAQRGLDSGWWGSRNVGSLVITKDSAVTAHRRQLPSLISHASHAASAATQASQPRFCGYRRESASPAPDGE